PPPPPPPATNIVVSGGDSQTAAPGQAVSTAPEVRVTNPQGNGVAGIAVQFAVVSGGGSVSKPTTTTNSQGTASAGTWTLGGQSGIQQLRATVSGLGSVIFSATAETPPEPASLEIVQGDDQTVIVGTSVSTTPTIRVLDAESNPVAGVTVTFTVTSGGGSVSGNVVTSNSAGQANVSGWTVGVVAGLNRLRASVAGVSPATFDATGTADAPAIVTSVSGDGQSATVNANVSTSPRVRVEDAHGNPVSGTTVTFAVTAGGGSASGGVATTDAGGIAAVGGWTLGATPGANTMTATAAGSGIAGNPVTFDATGTARSGSGGPFDIEIRFNPGSSPTGAQQAAYDAAEAKWEAIIVGDLPDVPVNRSAGTCSSSTAINETIDDLVIWVTLEPIDGAGGVLGSAGPCLIRNGSLLPLAGQMRFDTADLATLEANGLLDEVILHEMGHVLGIGTLWSSLSLLANPAAQGGTDPYFVGALAISAFDAVGGAGYAGSKVPVEAGGGSGTRDGHWRESVFDRELMTGWIDPGSNPLSTVTVQSLADIGYVADVSGADHFSLPGSASIVPRSGGVLALYLQNDLLLITLEILDAAGRTVGLIPR
ncbi:MAG: leishmanolysin-related zinc metalloendopeptidase, partial [Gemmatimonadota bacterium]